MRRKTTSEPERVRPGRVELRVVEGFSLSAWDARLTVRGEDGHTPVGMGRAGYREGDRAVIVHADELAELDKAAKLVGAARFLEAARKLGPLPTSLMATSDPKVLKRRPSTKRKGLPPGWLQTAPPHVAAAKRKAGKR